MNLNKPLESKLISKMKILLNYFMFWFHNPSLLWSELINIQIVVTDLCSSSSNQRTFIRCLLYSAYCTKDLERRDFSGPSLIITYENDALSLFIKIIVIYCN